MKKLFVVLNILFLLFFVETMSLRAGTFDFPKDPEGLRIIDRFFESVDIEGDDVLIYTRLYNTKDNCGIMDIYKGHKSEKGVVWKKIYTWKILFENQPVGIKINSVISAKIDDEIIQFSYIDDLQSYEGQITQYLEYDYIYGTFKESWTD